MNGYVGCAFYNHYLAKQINTSTEDLKVIVRDWDEKSLVGRVLSAFNPLGDAELRVKIARDLIDARENPDSETAKRVNSIIEQYQESIEGRLKKESRFAYAVYKIFDTILP